MLPFTKEKLNKTDYFYNYANAYKTLVELQNDEIRKTRNTIKNEYRNAYDQLKEFALDDDRWNHIDDLCRIIDMFYPGKKLAQSLDNERKDIDKFYIEYILSIARVFITFRDGCVAIRNWSKETDPFLNNYSEYEKIDLWNNITRTVTTDLFIAATYVNFNIHYDNIFNVPNLVSLADMPLKIILNRGLAETHMHANAGISYERVWRKQMQFQKTKEKSNSTYEDNLWFCTFFRYYAAMFIKNKSEVASFESYVFSELDENSKFDWFIERIQGKKTDFSYMKLNNFCVQNDILIENEVADSDILFEKYYFIHKERDVSAEILWYIDILRYLNKVHDRLLCSCFLRYLRYKNKFFSDKIQQTRIHGLDFFVEYFDNSTGTEVSKNDRKYYYVFEEQFKYGNLRLLEMKISPRTEDKIVNEEIAKKSIKRKTLKQIQSIMKSYKEYFEKQYPSKVEESSSEKNKSIEIPRIGIVYHFIKKEDSDNFNGFNCVFVDELGNLSCNDFNSMRRRYMVYMTALTELLSDYPILTDYVVGIDAAAKENATEPWVFAPVFKCARSSKKILPYVNNQYGKTGNVQNLGFTYHVGEDFRHIVSGLRHIDEVLTYFDYRSGDRLGHALALGVDIDYLVSLNSIVAVPIMEYLENLLWMWQYVNSTGDIGKIPDNLEYKIMETAKQIYDCNINGIDVYTLWRVYQDKFKLIRDTCYQKGKDNPCSIIEKLNTPNMKWDYSDLLMSHFCPCFYERYHKPIFVQTNTNVEFYKELQRSLINKVERMGVYVETNPTSNTAIGDIPSIFNHPIIRLNNRGLNVDKSNESCVLVSINSDDPIVFSTHVENEISYIYYSLLNAGCRREEALEWIDKIRRHGIDSSFIKSKKYSKLEIMKDIDAILEIDKINPI